MRRRSLLMAVSALVLATLACGPVVTPTPGREPSETAIAQTVQAQLATREPTATPPPTVVETVPPAVTDTPSRAPTKTLTPSPTAAVSEFEARLTANPDISFALGDPTGDPQETSAAEQPFQLGRMFWQQDTDVVHIVYNSGTFQTEPDGTIEGTEEDDYCPEVDDAPAGLFKPVRGFNWQWCNTAGVRDGLGWAQYEEVGYRATWQQFEGGHVLQSFRNHLYIFYEDGTWERIE